MAKRGRKKGQKNIYKGKPDNFYFWRSIIGSEQVNEFIKRGDIRQKHLIKQTLEYLKRGNNKMVIHDKNEEYQVENDLIYFEKIKGEEILKKL